MRARQAGDRQRPDAAAQRDRRSARDRRRPVAGRARLPPRRRSPAVELVGPRHALQRPRLSGAARRQPAAQRRRACWPRSRRCASGCRSARRRSAPAWRRSSCRAASRSSPGQPALVLDVAHNPHAVAALALNLDQMGFFPRTHAVFGAMRDKDIDAILARMAPLVDAWHFTDLPAARAASAARARRALRRASARRARPATAATAREPARGARRGAGRRGPR